MQKRGTVGGICNPRFRSIFRKQAAPQTGQTNHSWARPAITILYIRFRTEGRSEQICHATGDIIVGALRGYSISGPGQTMARICKDGERGLAAK